MSEFIKCNKIAGIHWFKQSLEAITFRIRLNSKDSILTLPKFEDYKEKSNEENLEILSNDKIEEYNFRWQEKVFSNWEYQKYSDVHNCSSEIDLKYHNMTKQLNYVRHKLFTYINEDYHLPLPLTSKTNVKHIVPKLSDCYSNFSVEKFRSYAGVSSSMRHLFRSEENLITDEDQWTAMHIVLDNSEYNEDSQLLYKEEHILVSVYHNATYNYLIVTPDVNDIQYNPYSVESQAEVEYGVEIDFREENGAELVELLNTLLRKCERKQKQSLNFVMPPLGRKMFFLVFEVISAKDFDLGKLYIEIHIKIPDNLQCNGDLHSRTHTSKYLKTEQNYEWRYGHQVELELECATGIDPLPVKIYLEAISVDWWGRHRTEGYSYLPLSLEPGEQKRHLSCTRPEELNPVEANNRRFFVGGCHLIKDLDLLSSPQKHNANFRYVSTGSLTVRWRIVSQSQAPGHFPETPQLSSSDLLSGADAVLRQYRKAKATLAAATRNLPTEVEASGDGLRP